MSFLINYKVSEDLKAYFKNSLYYILKTQIFFFSVISWWDGGSGEQTLPYRCLISFGAGLFTWGQFSINLGKGVPVQMEVRGQRKALGFVSQVLPIFFSPETLFPRPAAKEASGPCPHLPRFKVHAATPSWILGIKIRSPSFQGSHFTTCTITTAPGFHFSQCYFL